MLCIFPKSLRYLGFHQGNLRLFTFILKDKQRKENKQTKSHEYVKRNDYELLLTKKVT